MAKERGNLELPRPEPRKHCMQVECLHHTVLPVLLSGCH